MKTRIRSGSWRVFSAGLVRAGSSLRIGLSLVMTVAASYAFAQATALPVTESQASTQSSQSRTAAKAFDGDAQTRWEASNSSPGSWIAFQLRTSDTPRRVIFTEYGTRIAAWQLQVLQQDQTWSTVDAGTQGDAVADFANGDPYNKLRLYFPNRNTGQPSITTIRVLGTLSEGAAVCTVYDGTNATVIRGEADCQGGRYANACGTSAVFRLADGATLKNASITGLVECEGNCGFENVGLGTACSFAPRPNLAFVGSGRTATFNGGSLSPISTTTWGATLVMRNLKLNVASSLNKAPPYDAGPFAREPQPPAVNYDIENVRIESALAGPLAHIKTNNSKLRVRNLAINGYQPGAPVICASYLQNMDFVRSTGEQWNTAACDVSPSDIRAIQCTPGEGCTP